MVGTTSYAVHDAQVRLANETPTPEPTPLVQISSVGRAYYVPSGITLWDFPPNTPNRRSVEINQPVAVQVIKEQTVNGDPWFRLEVARSGGQNFQAWILLGSLIMDEPESMSWEEAQAKLAPQ